MMLKSACWAFCAVWALVIGDDSGPSPEIDHLVTPLRITMSGRFKLGSYPGIASCVTCPSDVEEYLAQNNWIEATVSVKRGVRYRCWAYAGACCQETFFVYYQSTGVKVREGDQVVTLDPGSDYAVPLAPKLADLPKRHHDHGGEKKPLRWKWLEIPFSPRMEGGLRKVRLYSDQKGFSVAAIIVSRRSEPPKQPPKLPRLK